MAEPRPAPLPPDQWPAGMQAARAALLPDRPRHPLPPRDPSRPKGLNVLGTLAHHPDLARAYHTLTGHVLFSTTLTPRQRELLILRVAAVRESEYEWAQHRVIAADVGLGPDEVDRVAEGPGAVAWADDDRALLQAVDDLLADARIDDGTWADLAAHLDTEQVLDLIFTVGTYDVLAMALLSFDVPLDDDLSGGPR